MKKLVMLGALAAALAAGAASNEDMVWGLMMQLGHNMWREMPLCTNGMTEAQLDWYACDFNRTDQKLWDRWREPPPRRRSGRTAPFRMSITASSPRA